MFYLPANIKSISTILGSFVPMDLIVLNNKIGTRKSATLAESLEFLYWL